MNKRIEFHAHTLLSDGELIPSELVRRAFVTDHEAIAITDHVDFSNIESVIRSTKRAAEASTDLEVLVGAEITHVPPEKIPKLVHKAKALGAQVVIVHGETLSEPVAPGTNHAAVSLEEVTILAHPGLIDSEDVRLASQNNVYLELSARCGHCIANGHVAQCKADLLVNTDCHSMELISTNEAQRIAQGAGLNRKVAKRITIQNATMLLSEIL
ncbi:MAG: histidinol phosphate phosphatase domain-containing protein [Halobacteriota archaeon]